MRTAAEFTIDDAFELARVTWDQGSAFQLVDGTFVVIGGSAMTEHLRTLLLLAALWSGAALSVFFVGLGVVWLWRRIRELRWTHRTRLYVSDDCKHDREPSEPRPPRRAA